MKSLPFCLGLGFTTVLGGCATWDPVSHLPPASAVDCAAVAAAVNALDPEGFRPTNAIYSVAMPQTLFMGGFGDHITADVAPGLKAAASPVDLSVCPQFSTQPGRGSIGMVRASNYSLWSRQLDENKARWVARPVYDRSQTHGFVGFGNQCDAELVEIRRDGAGNWKGTRTNFGWVCVA